MPYAVSPDVRGEGARQEPLLLIRLPSMNRSRRDFALDLRVASLAIVSGCLGLPGGISLLSGANPTGEIVVSGAATFDRLTDPQRLIIDTASDRTIVHWGDFSIGAGFTTTINQPGIKSAILNRVTTLNRSVLNGRLESNADVFLINPNGVVIGPSGQVVVGGFVASTLDVSNEEFLAGGRMTFSGTSTASVRNEGFIEAIQGNIFLIANRVENLGSLNAANGTVGLAAGTEVILTPDGDQKIAVSLTSGEGTVWNSGTLSAVQAELKAAGGNLYALAINNEGSIQATGVESREGRIFLSANSGQIENSGTISARNADGSGGQIFVGPSLDSSEAPDSTETFNLTTAPSFTNSGTMDASGTVGGSITVQAGQVFLGSSSRLLAIGSTGPGGSIFIQSGSRIDDQVGSLVDASGNSGGLIRFEAAEAITASGKLVVRGVGGSGGRIFLDAPSVQTIDATLDASGETGGLVQITGDTLLVDGATTISADGRLGGGTILIGGGLQGGDPLVRNAKALTVSRGSQLSANALISGNGGTVILWSDGATQFFGNIAARGGEFSGDGGFVEVSGQHLAYLGAADLRAPFGRFGTLLLDPTTIYIAASLSSANAAGMVGSDNSADIYSYFSGFEASGAVADSLLTTAALIAQLGLSDVLVTTSNPNGVGNGDIIVVDPIEWVSSAQLTLKADRNIDIRAAITGGNGILTLKALNSTGQVFQDAAAGITVNALELQGDAAFVLDSLNNDVWRLAANIGSNNLTIQNAPGSGLWIANVGATTGITTSGGSVFINTAGSRSPVQINRPIFSNGGDVAIYAHSVFSEQNALELNDEIRAGGGSIVLNGSSLYDSGVVLNASLTASGDITIVGKGDVGVRLDGTSISATGAGSIFIEGIGDYVGISFSGYEPSVTSEFGDITIRGEGFYDDGEVQYGTGIYDQSSFSTIRSIGGSMTVTGFGLDHGIYSEAGGLNLSNSDGGSIHLAASSYEIEVPGFVGIFTITNLGNGSTRISSNYELALDDFRYSTVLNGGGLTLEVESGSVFQGERALDVGLGTLTLLGFADFALDNPDNLIRSLKANVEQANVVTSTGLDVVGIGGYGDSLSAYRVELVANGGGNGGGITQSGSIATEHLALSSTGSVTLEDPNNNVGTLGSIQRGGAFTYVDMDDLILSGVIGGSNTSNNVFIQLLGSDMTFLPGSQIITTGSGSITLVAYGIFNNQAGPNVLSTGNGNWFIYTQSPGTTNLGGLSGSSAFSLLFPAAAPFAGSGVIYASAGLAPPPPGQGSDTGTGGPALPPSIPPPVGGAQPTFPQNPPLPPTPPTLGSNPESPGESSQVTLTDEGIVPLSGGGETEEQILEGNEVIEITGSSSGSILFSDAPKELRDALDDESLKRLNDAITDESGADGASDDEEGEQKEEELGANEYLVIGDEESGPLSNAPQELQDALDGQSESDLNDANNAPQAHLAIRQAVIS